MQGENVRRTFFDQPLALIALTSVKTSFGLFTSRREKDKPFGCETEGFGADREPEAFWDAKGSQLE